MNSIVDVYGDTLMSEKRKEKVDRDTILQIINKTEETVKNGIRKSFKQQRGEESSCDR